MILVIQENQPNLSPQVRTSRRHLSMPIRVFPGTSFNQSRSIDSGRRQPTEVLERIEYDAEHNESRYILCLSDAAPNTTSPMRWAVQPGSPPSAVLQLQHPFPLGGCVRECRATVLPRVTSFGMTDQSAIEVACSSRESFPRRPLPLSGGRRGHPTSVCVTQIRMGSKCEALLPGYSLLLKPRKPR